MNWPSSASWPRPIPPPRRPSATSASTSDKRHLRRLLDEGKAITKALAPVARAGLDVLPAIHNATVGDVIGAFRERPDQIRVFHFGGHASSSTLLFEDEAGKPSAAHAKGLADYLGQASGLVLVFLNGCSTEPQVRRLRAAGVKVVVATTHAIEDAVAAEFAETFYAELAVRPLRAAFDAAVSALQVRWGDDPRAVTRDVVAHDEPHTPSWPWVIDCDPAYEDWSLGAELARRRGRVRRRRLGLVAAATSLLLSMSLALSAEARRTACRAPGIRSLCAGIGIGAVPTAEEQALWEEALAQRSGDGLRAYLQAFPAGAHAEEARTRLAACFHVGIQTLGPEQDVPYPLTGVGRTGGTGLLEVHGDRSSLRLRVHRQGGLPRSRSHRVGSGALPVTIPGPARNGTSELAVGGEGQRVPVCAKVPSSRP